MDVIQLKVETVAGSCEHENENLDSVKARNFMSS
jgi:hypothetical protein